MEISEIKETELGPLLALYAHLKNENAPAPAAAQKALQEILSSKNHHLIVCREGGSLISSCALTIIPNLTRGARPYALIENVVTHTGYRKKGYGSAVLHYAKELALRQNCYKIMLMTGASEKSTHDFYKQAGYTGQDKQAYIMWL